MDSDLAAATWPGAFSRRRWWSTTRPIWTRSGADGPRAEVVTPSRHTPPSSPDDQGLDDRLLMHTLDAGSITDSFSALGVICGVVGPTDSAMETMRQADIVVLDWLLQDGDPQYALRFLRGLLAGEVDRNSLRLVAIYTGEASAGGNLCGCIRPN